VRASLVGVEDGCARVQLKEAVEAAAASRPIWLFQAQLRAGPLDTVIRMATELGVERIIPVRTQRTVAAGEKPERWARIATAAAAQSGRARVPQVSAPIPFEAALGAAPKSMSWWIAIPGAAPAPAATVPVAVLVGPEGGWTEQECTAACSAGWTPIGLGQGILRADTAAVVALSSALRDR
jgi:16S rRNA (uracil1498-N3)-methyltransferase